MIKKILFHDLKLKNKEVLVLGAGGFTLSAAGAHDNHFTYVDIDPDIKELVKRHYLTTIHGKFIAGDARQFVKKYTDHFDVIISDAYSNRNAIPAHLLTQEHFINVRHALKPGGLAIFNIIANPQMNNAFSVRVDNTIDSVFPKCMKLPLLYTSGRSNIIYLCRKSSQASDARLYKDDLNRATIDYFQGRY